MKKAVKLASGETHTLFDRYREAGLADRLVNEMDRRLMKRKRRRKAAVRAASAALVLLVVAFWAVPYVKDTSTVSIPVATQGAITLADGSRAELNANSQLKTDFRYGRRIVHLDHGEGFFSVVHDPSHPFLVETPNGTVRVTGTAFDVRLSPDGRMEVTLVEGRVMVKASDAASSDAVNLLPGQQATLLDTQPAVRTLTPSDMDRALAWRQGKIVLDGATLADVAAQFAEYHGCSITVDHTAAQVHLGGTYSLKNLPFFLEALKSTGAVQVLSSGEGSYRIVGH